MTDYKNHELPCDVELAGITYEKGTSLEKFMAKINQYHKVALEKSVDADKYKKLLDMILTKKWWQSNKSVVKAYQKIVDREIEEAREKAEKIKKDYLTSDVRSGSIVKNANGEIIG